MHIIKSNPQNHITTHSTFSDSPQIHFPYPFTYSFTNHKYIHNIDPGFIDNTSHIIIHKITIHSKNRFIDSFTSKHPKQKKIKKNDYPGLPPGPGPPSRGPPGPGFRGGGGRPGPGTGPHPAGPGPGPAGPPSPLPPAGPGEGGRGRGDPGPHPPRPAGRVFLHPARSRGHSPAGPAGRGPTRPRHPGPPSPLGFPKRKKGGGERGGGERRARGEGVEGEGWRGVEIRKEKKKR